MNRKRIVSLTFVVLGLLIGSCFAAFAAEPVVKVSSFKGEAYIQSGTTAVRVTQIGQTALSGDRIQTKEGEVELAFTDGAVMKINPFSTAMIQEREEESGFWVFKTKKLVRRMTAFVGKLYFRSGSSQRENYLQTPTAVAGIRGSSAEFGFDNVTSLLNLITGAINTYGTAWQQGAFNNPGFSAAARNAVYQKLANTIAQVEKAKQSGSANDQALAALNTYELAKLVGAELAKNPDPTIQQLGQGFVSQGEQGIANVRRQYPNLTTTVETTVPTTVTTTVPGKSEQIMTTAPTTVPTTILTTISTTSTTSTTSTSSSTTTVPTTVPTTAPTTSIPTTAPTTVSTTVPTTIPTTVPTTVPTTIPTTSTTAPTTVPTTIPTTVPTTVPTTITIPTTTIPPSQ